MFEATFDLISYKIPSNEIRHNRKSFYGLKKKRNELAEIWFNRVQSRINDCEFAKLTDIVLLDKFFCELNNDEIKSFQCTEIWSLKQLNDYFFGQNDVNECQMVVPLAAVKHEIVSIAKMYTFYKMQNRTNKMYCFLICRMTRHISKMNQAMNL